MPISPAGPDGPSGPGKPYINKAKNKVIRDEPDAKVPISRFFFDNFPDFSSIYFPILCKLDNLTL